MSITFVCLVNERRFYNERLIVIFLAEVNKFMFDRCFIFFKYKDIGIKVAVIQLALRPKFFINMG